jgi:hypothetical protein
LDHPVKTASICRLRFFNSAFFHLYDRSLLKIEAQIKKAKMAMMNAQSLDYDC